jgi:hypothetical protein
VTAAGLSRGIGKKSTENSIALFDTLDLGGEVIKNARLRIGDIKLGDADMLLGADFFLSHRVYVDSRANKVYFTYNGAPIRPRRATPRSAARARTPRVCAGAARPRRAGATSPPRSQTSTERSSSIPWIPRTTTSAGSPTL